MDDLISRQAAIEAVGEVHPLDYNAQSTVNRIKKIPSAQEWIPVSERMPEVGHNVLIAVDDGYVAEGCRAVDNTWVQYRWSTVLSEDKVIAWMPLPKPPKEE